MAENYSIDDILAELDKKRNVKKEPSDFQKNNKIHYDTGSASDIDKPPKFLTDNSKDNSPASKPSESDGLSLSPKGENPQIKTLNKHKDSKDESDIESEQLKKSASKVDAEKASELIKKPSPKVDREISSKRGKKKGKFSKTEPKGRNEEFAKESDNLSHNRDSKSAKSREGLFAKLNKNSHNKDLNVSETYIPSIKNDKINSRILKKEKEISTVDFFNKSVKKPKTPSNTQILDIINKFEQDELSTSDKTSNPAKEIFFSKKTNSSQKGDEALQNKERSNEKNLPKNSRFGDNNEHTNTFLPREDKEGGIFEERESQQARQKHKKGKNVFYEKAKPIPKPIIEDISGIEIKTSPTEISPLKGSDPVFTIDESGVLSLPKGRNPEDTDNIEIVDDRYKPPVFEDISESPLKTTSKIINNTKNHKPAEDARNIKEQEVFGQQLQFEPTADLIEGLNPYDVKKKAEKKDISEKPATPFDLSGDTQGIAGGDLKELVEKPSLPTGFINPTAEVGVKAYVPSFEKQKETPSLSKSGDNPLIESLNKTINEKIKQRSANNVKTPPKPPIEPAANVLNIDLKKKILKDTTLMPSITDPIEAQEKLEELSAKRRRRIKDFVLEERGDEDSLLDEEKDKTSDFDGFDVSGRIWEDLCKSHKWLKIRFALLLLLTGFLTFIAVANDTGISLGYRVLGFGVFFLDHRYDTFGFLLMNFLFGVFGLGVCSGLIQKGISKLFRRQGDCDSICAVSSLITVIGVIPLFLNTEAVATGKAHEFVAVGMGALLFNTIGKLLMITRAKRSFRFVFGDNTKYYGDIIKDTDLAGAFTKGAIDELPVLCAVRKTEFLTDFLKSIYCPDFSDKLAKTLTPIAITVSLLVGIVAYLLPGAEIGYNLQWAVTAGVGTISAFSAYSIMFLVSNPFRRASKALSKSDSLMLGYNSAVAFADVNSVLIDANSLFPPGSVAFYNIKRCQAKNAINTVAIDEAIITAASLAIKCNSILSSMFYDMIAGKSELLYETENCIYEVNMGITGWIGNRRVMLGNREQMIHHSIKIPDRRIERKYSTETGDVIYLAISGEAVAMFFIEIIPNPEIKRCLNEFELNGVSIAIRTRDSLVTVNKLSDIFDYDPERIKILPFNLHGKFDECTAYSSRGSGGLSCNGTFTSFAAALLAAKKLVKDISFSAATIFGSTFVALICSTVFMLTQRTEMFDPSSILLYNLSWIGIMLLFQSLRKY